MICPSCSESLTDSSKHCVHCGIAITRRSVQMAALFNNCGWIARRSLGGFFAGAFGLLLSMAVSRVLLFDASAPLSFAQYLSLFPGQSPYTTAIAGCFLGSVGGMIERSVYKSFLGGFLGTLGGVMGGLAFPLFEKLSQGLLYSYSLSMAGTWGITSAMVGLSSGLLESNASKILAGTLGGLLGGLLGGAIGSQMYGAMLMEIPDLNSFPWLAGRVLEGVAGGIVGVNVWAILGLSEKFYIFKRRLLLDANKKICDHCQAENGIRAWYCAQCGSALQVAASRGQIRVTPFRGLERISNAFQYLSWLSATAGVVTGLVVFAIFLTQNFLFALFGSLLVGLVVYSVSIFFRALADAVKMGILLSERLSHEGAPKPS